MPDNLINMIYHGPYTVEKVLTLVRILEDMVQPEKLDHYFNDLGMPVKIENMAEVLQKGYDTNQFPVLNNATMKSLISLSAYEIVPGPINHGYYKFQFAYPESIKITGTLFNRFKELAEATDAYTIDILPISQNYSSRDHTLFVGREHLPVKVDLPRLTNRPAAGQKMWEIPANFSWINFWSEELVDLLGLKYDTDKELFYHSVLINGGLVFQLTEKPLNVMDEDHLEILKKCYERFERIGNQFLLKK